MMWTCPKCGTKVDPSFEVCWQCGTSSEGVEDASFVRADDDEPIGDPPVAPTLESIADSSAMPGADLVECYQALTLMEAQFLANELVQQGIPAVSDQQDLQDALGTWGGNPRVYVRSEDLPRARVWLAEYDEKHRADVRRRLEQSP